MSIRKLSQLLGLMALLAVPFALTSCDDDDWYYDDYWNGYYPDDDNNGSEADQMVAVLSGRWQGDMVYTYTDDNAKPGEKKRVSEKYAVEMTFYRSENAKDRYAGQGVEVDRNDQGDTQALNFTWWIDTRNGDIYIKYTDSNTIFRMDAASTDYGYHLGWETSRNAYTFFGYLVGQSNDDEIYIDLERVEIPRKAKAATETTPLGTQSFGSTVDRWTPTWTLTSSKGFHRR